MRPEWNALSAAPSRDLRGAIEQWVAHVAAHTTPSQVRWWNGTEDERRELEESLLRAGSLERVPGGTGVIHRARTRADAALDSVTFMSAPDPAHVGPLNTFMSQSTGSERMWPLFRESMRDRVMYVVPYVLGPASWPTWRVGVQLTDSPHLVLMLHRLVRTGPSALSPGTVDVVRLLHSLGDGVSGREMASHFVESRSVWGIGMDASSFLRRRSHSLRLASALSPAEGWVAARMSVVGITSPRGAKYHLGGVFARGAGQTTFALLRSHLPRWKVETFSDDVTWLRAGSDGRLRAINPDMGLHASLYGSPSRALAEAIEDSAFFTYPRGPERVDVGRVVLRMNALPLASASCAEPEGVPIDAILFGVRRTQVVPLAVEATGWEHGCYLGATMLSEHPHFPGELRWDPMAMRSLCGTHMNSYLAAWLALARSASQVPRVYLVNPHRQAGSTLSAWPGHDANMHILRWIVSRLEGTGAATPTVAGFVPTAESLDADSLGLSRATLERLLDVDPSEWGEELVRHRDAVAELADGYPFELRREHAVNVNRVRETTRRQRIQTVDREESR